jgi:hypothetical protein
MYPAGSCQEMQTNCKQVKSELVSVLSKYALPLNEISREQISREHSDN